MNAVSTRQPGFPPKLDRLLLDADINPLVVPYLEAVGFDVLFAPRESGIDIHDDKAIVKWARQHRRFLVCHDKFKDKQTRLGLYFEVYENGGQIIQIHGGPQQHPTVSLGKILVNREKWLEFFSEFEDGIVRLSTYNVTSYTPDKLHKEIQRLIVDPIGVLDRPRKARKRHFGPVRPRQYRLNLPP